MPTLTGVRALVVKAGGSCHAPPCEILTGVGIDVDLVRVASVDVEERLFHSWRDWSICVCDLASEPERTIEIAERFAQVGLPIVFTNADAAAIEIARALVPTATHADAGPDALLHALHAVAPELAQGWINMHCFPEDTLHAVEANAIPLGWGVRRCSSGGVEGAATGAWIEVHDVRALGGIAYVREILANRHTRHCDHLFVDAALTPSDANALVCDRFTFQSTVRRAELVATLCRYIAERSGPNRRRGVCSPFARI